MQCKRYGGTLQGRFSKKKRIIYNQARYIRTVTTTKKPRIAQTKGTEEDMYTVGTKSFAARYDKRPRSIQEVIIARPERCRRRVDPFEGRTMRVKEGL